MTPDMVCFFFLSFFPAFCCKFLGQLVEYLKGRKIESLKAC